MKQIEIKKKLNKILEENSFEDNQDFLFWVLQRHPDKEKIKDAVKIIPNDMNNGYCMVLSNGDIKSVSLKHKCCTGRTSKPNIIEAMRSEIYNQIEDFRINNGFVGMGKEFHVGHGTGEKKFISIANKFLNTVQCQIKLTKKKLREHLQYEVYVFEDRILAQKWYDFHEHHCELKMQTAEENLKER